MTTDRRLPPGPPLPRVHVVWCAGCGNAWLEFEQLLRGRLVSSSGVGCACTCAEGDPRYEEWRVDPAEHPPPAAFRRFAEMVMTAAAQHAGYGVN